MEKLKKNKKGEKKRKKTKSRLDKIIEQEIEEEKPTKNTFEWRILTS